MFFHKQILFCTPTTNERCKHVDSFSIDDLRCDEKENDLPDVLLVTMKRAMVNIEIFDIINERTEEKRM